MLDDAFLLGVQRLRDDLSELRVGLKSRFGKATAPVTSSDLKAKAASLAEKWMVEVAPRLQGVPGINPNSIANLTVEFQRLLRYSEHSSQRALYERAIKAILKGFTPDIVIPAKQSRGTATEAQSTPPRGALKLTAFVGHSFATEDESTIGAIIGVLQSIGLQTVTGEKPRADKVSEKVKRAIDSQSIFVGVFTRREKLARKATWTTSAWVIDEKAYATAKGKVLVLLTEDGVESIGGIQGDHEYIPFDRDDLGNLFLKLIGLFELENHGLKQD